MLEVLQSVDMIFRQLVDGRGFTKAVVEAGHIYTDETPGVAHQLSAGIGGKILRECARIGIEAKGMLFVDDYNAEAFNVDLHGYVSSLAACGFPVSRIVMESSMQEGAESVIGQLAGLGLIKNKKDKRTVYPHNEGEVLLRKSEKAGGGPACDALDSALYIHKATNLDLLCITVLPESYRPQQVRVGRVLAALNTRIPILNVFFTDRGEVNMLLNN